MDGWISRWRGLQPKHRIRTQTNHLVCSFGNAPGHPPKSLCLKIQPALVGFFWPNDFPLLKGSMVNWCPVSQASIIRVTQIIHPPTRKLRDRKLKFNGQWRYTKGPARRVTSLHRMYTCAFRHGYVYSTSRTHGLAVVFFTCISKSWLSKRAGWSFS